MYQGHVPTDVRPEHNVVPYEPKVRRDGADDGVRYKRPGRLGLALQAMFALWVLIAAVLFANSLALYDFLGGLLRSPLGVEVDAFQSAMNRANAITIAELAASLVTAGFFIAWTHRVYSNLPALGARSLPFSSGWAIGAWFVPFLNLVRPKQIIDAAYRVTHPDHTLEPGTAWRFIRISPLVHWWWGLFIVMRLLSPTFDAGASPSVNGLRTHALALAAASALEIVAAVLAFLLVTRITSNQIDRHNRMVMSEPAESRPIRDRRWGMRPVRAWMAGLAVGALVLGAFTYSTSNLDGGGADDTAERDGSGTIVSAGGLLLDDLRPGDCFNDPTEFDLVLAVEAVPCGAPHDNEVFSIFQLPAERGAPYPGEQQIMIDASGRCIGNMEGYVGVPFNESGLDVFTILPVEISWAVGDRRVVCSAYDLGLEPLRSSVRSTGGVIPEGFGTVWSLASGECFEESYGTFIPIVPCSGPHFGTVFASFDLETPELSATIDDEVGDLCVTRAEAAFTSLELAGLEVFALRWPGPATWVGGDREVACVAIDITAES